MPVSREANNTAPGPGIGSDINLAFRPDDNHHLIVQEYFLDLNLAMATACELSLISSQPVRIRIVHLRKDFMPSGKEAVIDDRIASRSVCLMS